MSDEARKKIERWWDETRWLDGPGWWCRVRDIDEALAGMNSANAVADYLDEILKEQVSDLLSGLRPDGPACDCHPTPLDVFEHLAWLMRKPGSWLVPIFTDFFGDPKWAHYTRAWDKPTYD